jgi:uncharacterized protein YchJ
MKQTSIASKYQSINMEEGVIKRILRDMRSGMTEKAIIEKYRLSSSQYQNLRTVMNETSNLSGNGKPLNERGIDLDNFKKKSGAKKQGSKEVCLCGSGRFYGRCCGLK